MLAIQSKNANRIVFATCAALLCWSEVIAQKPAAAFTVNSTTGCFPLIVTFTDTSSNNPTSWLWDFGNGNTSAFQNPSATYSTAGTYTVKLIACNSNGCDTLIKNNYITAVDKPIASFITPDTAGCAPLGVQFSDNSIPVSSPIVSWNWDFGDGNFSYQQNPLYIYSFPGIYNVSLSVTDSLGCNHSIVTDSFIVVSIPPGISFSADTASSCAVPFAVNFSNNTTTGSYPIVSWLWDFGDTFSDTAMNTLHTYDSAGTFSITLTATDSIGCKTQLTDTNAVSIGKDSADFTYSAVRTCDNLQVSFSASANDSIAEWTWDFGDGTGPASGQNVTHNYSNSGVFNVVLIATNLSGCPDTVSKTLSYLKVDAGFSADTLYACSAPFTVNFTNASTGTPPLGFQWNFDYDSQFGFLQQSIAQNPVYSYASDGFYDVMLVVSDSFGCTDTVTLWSMNDSIIISIPDADFTVNNFEGCGPLSVDFTDASNGFSFPIVAWAWNFDDTISGVSNYSALQNPTHIFNDTFKSHTVQLTVTNSLGCADSVTGMVRTGYPTFAISLSKSADTACHGAPVDFVAFYSDSNINGGYWNWGDGFVSTGLTTASHPFQALGDIIVQFSPMVNGCIGAPVDDSIYILAPKPLFTATPDFSCRAPLTVNFMNNSLSADSVWWNFGDGSPLSFLSNPSHTYTIPGTYYVYLTVMNDSTGCTDSIWEWINIPHPVADFAANKFSGCAPLTVSFTSSATTSLPAQYPIVNYSWDFGDGITSTQKNPVHTYTDTSSFTVTLIITDAAGCKDTLIKPGYINTSAVSAAFIFGSSVGCPPFPVQFTDQSNSNLPIASWNWNFDDGSPVDTMQNPNHTFTSPGEFTPSLTISDGFGCTGTYVATTAIVVTKPNAQFSAPVKTCLFTSTTFINTTPGTASSFTWDFGDGSSTSSQQNTMHTYTDTGMFTVSLIATDTNNCTDTAISPVEGIAPPVANFTLDTFLALCPPLLIQFSDLSSNINDSIISWKWNFGDNGIATVQSPIHTYSYADTFSVRLLVTNSTGCTDTLIIPDMIKISGPYGNFDFTPDTGCVPLPVFFNANTGNTEKFIWDFGDGILDTTAVPSNTHIYIQAGLHNPQLSLVDSLGCKVASLPLVNSILYMDEVVSDFTFTPFSLFTPLCPPDTVFFTSTSMAFNDSSLITNWLWNFGDGDSDTVNNPFHVYTDTGTYAVSLVSYSSLGCSDTIAKNYNVTLNDSLVLKAIIQNAKEVSCNGLNDGEATASGLSGTAPYNFLWSSGDSTSLAPGLSSGLYSVTVTDANGCIAVNSVSIAEPSALNVFITATEVSCQGGNDGSLSAAVSGGISPYEFLWTNSSDTIAATSAVNNLPARVYYVTVTDSNGCTYTLNDTIREPDSLLIFILDTIPAACYGDSTGNAIVGASGGNTPYSYNWSPVFAGTGDTAVSLPAQNYTVVLIDNKGCDTSLSFDISQPSQLTTSLTPDAISCYNGNDGSVTANPGGGTPLYFYLWSTGDSLAIITNLAAGVYPVTISDANGCTIYDSAQVSQPDSLTIIFSTDSISCYGGSDGSAGALPGGGTPPYAYLWNSGDTVNNINSLTSAMVHVTVTDSAGCLVYDSVKAPEPDSISLSLISDSVSCFEGNDGSASVIANGGTVPYTYLWDDGNTQVTSIATGLTSGIRMVTVTDANNCFSVDTITLYEPAPIILDIITSDALCFGDSSGTAEVSVSGGSPPYTYLWNTGASTSSASGFSAETYYVTVSDNNNCTADTQGIVSEPTKLIVSITKYDVTCYNGNDGSAEAIPGGGISPYLYSWSDFQTDSTATGLNAGVYYVTVSDSNNCNVTDSAMVLQSSQIVFSFTTEYATCYGDSDGSATVIPGGGIPPYTFLWNDSSSQTGETAIGLFSSYWMVTVTDSAGCTAYDSVSVSQPDSITLSFNADSVSCFDGNNGSAVSTANGGNPPYTYLWNDSTLQSSQTLTGVSAGTYVLIVSDSNNCQGVDSVFIAEPWALTLDMNATGVSCNDDSNGTAEITVSGGTSPYNFQWNDPEAQATSTATGLPPGTWMVIISDTNNCMADTEVVVTEPSVLIVSILEIRSLLCNGKNNGELEAQPTGGSQPYNYLWEPTNADTSFADNLFPGQYTLTVTDTNGCTASDTAEITELSPLSIVISQNDSDTACYNLAYAMNAQPSGSAAPYSYYWTNGGNSMDSNPVEVFPLNSETWSVTVTDSAGCTVSGSTFLFVNQLEVIIDHPDTACLYSETTFMAIASGALSDSVYYYQWNTGDTSSIINVSLADISYQVVVSDGCSEPGSASASVYTYPEPVIKIKIKPYPVCPNTVIIFSQLQSNPDYLHTWNFGDNTFDEGKDVQHAYSTGGEYYPSVTLTAPNGCLYTVTAYQPVIVFSSPQVDFEAKPFETSILFPLIEFNDLSSVTPVAQDEITDYHWNFGDGSTSEMQHVSHTYNDTGTYTVTFTLGTQYGCQSELSKEVVIRPYVDLRIPTAFTPGAFGSSGGYYDSQSFDNDVFYPITKYVSDYSMQIFNRWGEMIFESANIAIGWDGDYQGKPAQQDTYIWKIKIVWVTGENFNDEGRVLLIR